MCVKGKADYSSKFDVPNAAYPLSFRVFAFFVRKSDNKNRETGQESGTLITLRCEGSFFVLTSGAPMVTFRGL